MLTRNVVQIIGALFIMFYYSWRLTSVILSVVPVICIGAVVYGRQVRGLRKRFQDTLAKAAKTAEESISSVRTVRAFANEDKASDKYNEDITDSFGIGVKTALAAGGFFGAVSFLFQGAIVLVLWYGGTLVLDGHMTTGLLTTFMLYTLTTAMSIGVLSSVYGDLMQAVGASDRLFKLLDTLPQIEPDFDPTQSPQTKRKRTSSSVVTSYGALRTPSQRASATAAQNLHSQSAQSHAHATQRSYGDVEAPSTATVSTALRSARPAPATKTLGQGWGQISVPVMTSTRQQPHTRIRGHIEFRDVSFAYPSRSDVMVIDDVSLTVAQGSVVALVGPSGGGKSTIISLLERFYDPVQGQVLVDGVDIRTHHPHEYRRQLALVGQEPVLFATTINENIAYGVEGATQEEVIQAAMKVCVL
ncbi:hypothetical protein SARC_03051 [Sphaeroforma arctica JP610]|uniref:ABC transmembrane type-1 domain-containing protein n=1 Tax=Sphaeroforma arctica JP610 TaxID=667725 RepID=A0A0L0G745_9EUKA|nr:hypothetical protein SARC_03051 [Sphaeroforma arctica JP610]KNC84739.1 hypothetical protein SARC_03051 [Sphaeroforma arctica JP610]|eukprot:XP_014158641.1 hypothetical protein SARC_03051 [Sphaeroforma arctica JP610]